MSDRKKSKRRLKMIDDLLTVKQRKELQRDLAKMAKQRRDAEAATRNWRLP